MTLATSQKIRRYPSISDQVLIDIFRALLKEDYLDEASLSFGGNTHEKFDSEPQLEKIVDTHNLAEGRVISSATFSAKLLYDDDSEDIIYLSFRRQIKTEVAVSNQLREVYVPSTYECEFEVTNWPSANFTTRTILQIIDDQCLGSSSGAAKLTVPDELLAAISAQVTALSSATRSAYDDVRKARAEMEDELSARRTELDKQFTLREQKLKEQNDAELASIEEAQNALAEKISEVDDRESKHVRRQLRKDITTEVKERLKKPIVSDEVKNARRAILWLGLFGTILPAVIVAEAIYEFATAENMQLQQIVATGIRLAASSAAFFFMIVYVTSYMKRVTDEDTRNQHQMERYALDLDRASWVIETVIEIEGSERTSVPKEWIENVTTDMFGAAADNDSDEKTALDALGEILGSGASLELNGSGGTLNIGPKAAKKMAKAGSNSD